MGWHRMFMCILFLFAASMVRAEGHPFDNSRMAEIDGLRMHYRYWEGAGGHPRASVLLVHGFGGSTFSWQEVADTLHRMGYEVVAVDLPPFGYSDKSHKINQSFTAHAERMHQLVHERYPGRTWHVAGHSMGGAVSQAYALMYPRDLASATFVSAALFPELPRTEQQISFFLRLSPLRFFFGELAEEWVIRERRLERMLESAYGVEPTSEQVRSYLEPLEIPGTARAILSAAAYHKELVRLDARDLRVPSIAIWGDQDSWVPHDSRLPSLDRMPQTEVILLEGVGHNPMETHLDVFLDTWLPFLEAMSAHRSPSPGVRIFHSEQATRRQGNVFVSVLSHVIWESIAPAARWDQVNIPFVVPHVSWEALPALPEVDESAIGDIREWFSNAFRSLKGKACSAYAAIRKVDLCNAPEAILARVKDSE